MKQEKEFKRGMHGHRESWLEILRSLGEAFLEVVQAEIGVVLEHWKRSGLHMAIIVALFVFAFGFLAIGGTLGVYTVVAMLHEMAGWSWARSGGTVAFTVFLLAGLCAGIGYLRLRRLESPAAAFRDRVSDHMDWWKVGILKEDQKLPEMVGGEGGLHGNTDAGNDPAGESTR